MQTNVQVAKATQSAVPELNMAEKTLYYLIIGSGDAKVQINVGEKTYNAVKKLEDREGKKIEEHNAQVIKEEEGAKLTIDEKNKKQTAK